MIQNRMNRRRFIAMGGAAGAATALSGLLGRSTLAAPFAQTATTLDVWNDKPTWQPWLDEMSKLSSSDISIGIKSVPYADTSTYQAAIRSALTSSQAPDLFTWWSGWWMHDLATADVLEDLSDIWKKYIDAGEVNADLAKPYTFNGKILGVPTANNYYVVFYNTAVFKQLSLEPPKTWDEFMSVCDALKKGGVTPLGVTVQDQWPSFIWFQQLLIGTDPKLYEDLTAGKIKYTDDSVVQVMNTWKDMIDKQYFSDPTIPGVGTTGQSELANLFRQGKIGMILWGDWYIPFLTADNFVAGDNFSMFPCPKLNESAPNAAIFETGPFALANHSAHLDDAKKFIDWWISAPAQTEWIKLYPGIPTNAKVDPGNAVLDAEMAAIAAGNYQLLTRYWEATPTDIVLQAVDQLDRFMLDPTSLENVLSTIQQTADTYWAAHPAED